MTGIQRIAWAAMIGLFPAALASPQGLPKVVLSIAAPSATLISGEGLRISIAVKNNLAEPISVYNLLPGAPDRPAEGPAVFSIHVVDERGRPAPSSAYARATRGARWGSSIIQQLAPGAVLRTQAIVTQYFDISAPGHYRVWVTLKRGPYSSIKSNTLTLSVKAPG